MTGDTGSALMGSERTSLVVLRGNSGSGKTTTARIVRERLGRGVAWVEQDHLRRKLLWEKDKPDGVNIGLIAHTVQYALDHGYHVILEGIMHAGRYAGMLEGLSRRHRGTTRFFYFDVTFEETVRRHATRPKVAEFTPRQMRDWYRSRDLLDFVAETVIPQDQGLADTVDQIAGVVPGPPPAQHSGAANVSTA